MALAPGLWPRLVYMLGHESGGAVSHQDRVEHAELTLTVGGETDFCVWTLERLGVRVPPFVLHPEAAPTHGVRTPEPSEWKLWLVKA